MTTFLVTAYVAIAFIVFVTLLNVMTPEYSTVGDRVRLIVPALTAAWLWPLTAIFGTLATVAYVVTRSASEGLDV